MNTVHNEPNFENDVTIGKYLPKKWTMIFVKFSLQKMYMIFKELHFSSYMCILSVNVNKFVKNV